MKRTLMTTALLGVLSGTALAKGSTALDALLPTTSESKTTVMSTSDDEVTMNLTAITDDHKYEIKIVNDKTTVKLDGKKLPAKRFKRTPTNVIIYDKHGDEMYSFEYQMAGKKAFAAVLPPPTPRVQYKVHTSDDGMSEWVTTSDFVNLKDVEIDIQRPRVMLGIYTGDPSEQQLDELGIKHDAILVEGVIKGLSADRAGMKVKDIIVSIEDFDGVSTDGLTKVLREFDPGDNVEIVVIRDGKKKVLETKLLAYDAEALAPTRRASTQRQAIGQRFPGSSRVVPGARRFFTDEHKNNTRVKILEAIRSSGIDDDLVETIEESLGNALDENVWKFFGDEGNELAVLIEPHIAQLAEEGEHRARLVEERTLRKAEDALRHAERMTMEFKDGELLLRRHTEDLEERMHELNERIHESIPEIEEELHHRMEELESRLDELESVLDSRMEGLTGLIERLIERLEEDADED